MALRPTLLAAGLAAAMLAVLGTLPAAVAQFRPDWSPWGGPDSPGGLFGGDPLDVEPHQDQPLHPDQVWTWMFNRFQAADRNRDGRVSMDEMAVSPTAGGGSAADRSRAAWFRAADMNHDGHLSPEELKMFSGVVFRFHDLDGDGRLARHEVRRQPPAPAGAGPAAAAPAQPGAPARPAPAQR